MFDTIRLLPALLQVRCRDRTNVHTFLLQGTIFLYAHNVFIHNALRHSVKKSTSDNGKQMPKRPKTELDERFLATATQVMKSHGITSDRAISLELGRGVDFINRIRRGLQSAPAEAWDTLLNKYPEARNITSVSVQGNGQAVGTIYGDNTYAPTTLEACQLELEQHKRDLAASRGEVEQLKQQVASQERLISSLENTVASKEEIISLLRGGYNRPN